MKKILKLSVAAGLMASFFGVTAQALEPCKVYVSIGGGYARTGATKFGAKVTSWSDDVIEKYTTQAGTPAAYPELSAILATTDYKALASPESTLMSKSIGGYAAQAKVGYSINENMMVSAWFDYANNKGDIGFLYTEDAFAKVFKYKMRTMSGGLSVAYYFGNSGKISPFVEAGLSLDRVKRSIAMNKTSGFAMVSNSNTATVATLPNASIFEPAAISKNSLGVKLGVGIVGEISSNVSLALQASFKNVRGVDMPSDFTVLNYVPLASGAVDKFNSIKTVSNVSAQRTWITTYTASLMFKF